MDFLSSPRAGPRSRGPDGRPRQVGVEIEFAAVSARDAAGIVQRLLGGTVREEDPHRFHIDGTRMGDFTCELDTQYAHRPHDAPAGEKMREVEAELRRAFGNLSAAIMPCEIVCPPIPVETLPELDRLVAALAAAGAEGTGQSPFYAFGAQFNPEAPSLDAAALRSVLAAYLMLSPWLRGVMEIDLTRRAVAFADPFPDRFVRKAVDPGWRPDMAELIDAYLADNPTRNRELDMLPLFAHLDAERVRAAVDDPRIKPRPTFHYRLPDARIGQAQWSLCLEWNRWIVVERVAFDPDLLRAMAEDFLDRLDGAGRRNWPLRCSQWLVLA